MFSCAFFSSAIVETHCEQQIVIKFYFKNELTASKTFKMLQKVYGNECPSHTNVFEWYGKFRNCWENVDDDPRAGRLRASRTPEHIAKVCTALADGRRSMIRMWLNGSTLMKKLFTKLSGKFRGKKVVCAICSPCADVRTMGRSCNLL